MSWIMHFLEGGHHRQNLKSRLQEQGAFIHRNTRNTKKKFLALQIYFILLHQKLRIQSEGCKVISLQQKINDV